MPHPATLFYHSDVADPYAFYDQRLHSQPLFWDESQQIWAAYSYEVCQQLLTHPACVVPTGVPDGITGLSALAWAVRTKLVRLSNPPVHQHARQLALGLVGTMQPVDLPELLADLLNPFEQAGAVDWVEGVAKKVPALAVLAGLHFAKADRAVLSEWVGVLTKLMLPQPSKSECRAINETVDLLVPMLEQHIRSTPRLRALLATSTDPPTALLTLVSNLLGLLIQSYDAGRGLLINALVQTLNQSPPPGTPLSDLRYLRRVVVETLRFDPPIHHTRRVLASDAVVEGASLRKGQSVILFLAAANRDARRFTQPHQFDPDRSTNGALLAFGAGIHACLARHTAVEQTAQALAYLFATYPTLRLVDAPVEYEPLFNARLRRQLRILLY